jgi:hypothetical protein
MTPEQILAAGAELSNHHQTLQSIESSVRADFDSRRLPSAAKLSAATVDHSSAVAELNGAEAQAVSAATAYERLRDDFRRAPRAYSLSRGFLYLLVACLFFIADFAILGVVLARLTGTAFRDPEGGSVSAMFLRNPMDAYGKFPDLLVLTAGVLLLGWVVKMWLELSPSSAESDNERRLRVVVGMVTGLSVLALLATATSRFVAPPDVENPAAWVGHLVSALLGAALPFGSVLFVVVGLDRIGRRTGLWAAGIRAMAYRRRLKQVEKREKATKASVESARTESEQWAEPQLAYRLELARADFRASYAAGVRSLFERRDGTSVYARLQPIIVRRLLTRDR